jgi:transposase
MIDSKPSRERDLVVAMIVSRIIDPGSKLATSRGLGEETQTSSLGETLGIKTSDEDDLYAAMDWLLERQGKIEKKLAKKHLSGGSLVLYDLTSTYFEGATCPLAHLGYSRDGKKDKLQIVFGLLCDVEGCPVAVEVFPGNTSDSKTLSSQIQKVRENFGLDRVILVGDRGMITEARIREEMRGVDGLDWITALRAPAIKKLITEETLQLSLFDRMDMGEIIHPDYPGERLIACMNPLLAARRAFKRESLLQATERELNKIVQATNRSNRCLKGKDKIGIRVGKVLGRFKVAKHFITEITEDSFSYERNTTSISEESALDGIYVVRTSVSDEVLDAKDTVRAYKGLSVVERAFRSYKSVDLKVRPIYHHLDKRVRAHVFLCMLAYYVEWHMRQKLAPILFDDDDKESGEALRESIVAPAQRSEKAKRKARTKRTEEDMPVHSFQTLLKDLATIVKDRIQPKLADAEQFDKITRPTPLQQKALDLLSVKM